ncbi:MAG: Type II restriction adenine-specific methylase [Firmicutes bacterium]|nr:Type II restriction adenine-specific methylase [Bacillota bacterium]
MRNNIGKYLNKIHEGDCIELMGDLDDESIDLIFADPPYFLQLRGDLYRTNQAKVDAVNDEWDKFQGYGEYDEFTYNWLKECRRVLKKDGTIWVIGTYHNIFRVGKIMQDLGYWILNDVVWIKSNPMPNFKGTRFNNAHETLIWASKSEASKYTFHYKSLKTYNEDKQMRSDWDIPICIGNERIKINGKKAHSTQKPEELLYRVILASSDVGDIVLDPFMGSGTTGAVAKKLHRNFIGFEKEAEYVQIANERIESVKPIENKRLLEYRIEYKPPKVPFGDLIASGYIKVGEALYSKDKKYKAIVQADSSLTYKDTVGSIHRVSADILGKKANNGWDYWYVERNGDLISIDGLRRQACHGQTK